MIWEKDVSVIVMMTNIEECGNVKLFPMKFLYEYFIFRINVISTGQKKVQKYMEKSKSR